MNSYCTRLSLTLIFCLAIFGTSCGDHPIARVQARYWPGSPETLVRFPEQDGSIWSELRTKDNLGICFSGGGTRSAAASVGQLRALSELGILPRARYISAASGGSWTATPYTFIPPSQMANFLEPYVAPGNLTSDDLIPQSNSMTEAVSNAYVTAKGLTHLFELRGSESYARTVGDCFLAPFHLNQPDSWFTWNEQTAATILRRNGNEAELTLKRYQTVPKGRPFLIVGGTIRHYDTAPWLWSNNDPNKRIPVEYTPLYSGVRPWFGTGKYNSNPIGGGYVESFAYDSMNPKKDANHIANVSLSRRGLWRTTPVLTLADIMGSSGAAPGEVNFALETLGFPKFNYWSPQALQNEKSLPAARYAQLDGGLSEDLALMPLLARRVDRIVVFVNAEKKVRVGNGPPEFPDYIEGLFGCPGAAGGWYHSTQVFETPALDEIAADVAKSIHEGGPAVAASRLRVRRNTRFGVEPYIVKIFWVFLEGEVAGMNQKSSSNWIQKMPEKSEAHQMFDGQHSRFEHFPNYHTFAENQGLRVWDIIRMYPEQATLLAHYTSWTVKQSGNDLRSFLAD